MGVAALDPSYVSLRGARRCVDKHAQRAKGSKPLSMRSFLVSFRDRAPEKGLRCGAAVGGGCEWV